MPPLQNHRYVAIINKLFEVVATPDVDVVDAVVVDVVDVVDVVVVVDVVDAVEEDTFVPPPVMQAGPEYVFLNVYTFPSGSGTPWSLYTRRSFYPRILAFVLFLKHLAKRQAFHFFPDFVVVWLHFVVLISTACFISIEIT
jgi:hypothetical protein